MIETFTPAGFAARLGETFRIHPPGLDQAPLEACLVDVAPAPGTVREGPPVSQSAPGNAVWRTPFAIVLRGPHTPVLPQRTYELSHPALGTFGLFLVPIGPDATGMRYEAVFG
jgi:hypothetical protein